MRRAGHFQRSESGDDSGPDRRTAARLSCPRRRSVAGRCLPMRACAMWRALWRARISRALCAGDFDAIITNAAGLRLDAQGVRASFRGGRPHRITQAAEFSAKMRDVTEFLAEPGTCRAAALAAAARHLSGFVPSAARPENPRGPAETDSRRPGRGARRHAARGSVLRLGWRLTTSPKRKLRSNCWR